MVRAKLDSGSRYSTPVHERPLHPTRSHLTPEASQTQAPVTPATEPEQCTGGGLNNSLAGFVFGIAGLDAARFFVCSTTCEKL